MAWDVAPACTVVSQGYACTDYSGEFRCTGCGTGFFHAGIDLSGPSASIFRSPVLATRSGVVSAVGVQYLGDQAVAVKTDEGVTIEHGHLDQASVSVGQRVNVGDQLGLLGTRGQSTGPHLHLEVRTDGPFQGVGGCPQNDPTRNPVPYLRASYRVAGLDSSFFRPTPAIARQARAAGVQLWSGYLATKANVGLASPWDRESFENARLCGGRPIAWCSGWDDPVACKDLCAAWNVVPGLDVESGIRAGLTAEEKRHRELRMTVRGPRRADGSWVQPWLDACGAGLYGNAGVHAGRRALFHVLAAYPGHDPGTVWPNSVERPDPPAAWQWQGTHDEFGGAVDRGWFESWFVGAGAAPAPPPLTQGGGMLVYDTLTPSSVYQVTIGTDGRFYARKGWDQGLTDLDWVDLSTPAAPVFAAQSAAIALKPDGRFYTVEALAPDGSIWSSVRAWDGSVIQDWKAHVGTARLAGGAAGPAGPPGPAYDDSEVRRQLQQLTQKVAEVAQVLGK